jgi:hypothetical protein
LALQPIVQVEDGKVVVVLAVSGAVAAAESRRFPKKVEVLANALAGQVGTPACRGARRDLIDLSVRRGQRKRENGGDGAGLHVERVDRE